MGISGTILTRNSEFHIVLLAINRCLVFSFLNLPKDKMMYGMFSSQVQYQINKYMTFTLFCYSDSLRERNSERKQLNFLPLTTFFLLFQGRKSWNLPCRNGIKVLSATSGK